MNKKTQERFERRKREWHEENILFEELKSQKKELEYYDGI